MPLVTAKEVAKVLAIEKLGFLGNFIGCLLLKATRITVINTHYDAQCHLNGHSYCAAVLDHFGVRYQVAKKELERIPSEGAFITISNHPLGLLDGVILMKLLLEQREDTKVMSNFLLKRVVPVSPYVIPVNPFENRKEVQSSLGGIKQALAHLKSGAGLGIFPAGEVATIKKKGRIEDKYWEPSVMKLIQHAQVPIVPIYFHARNSHLFYWLSGLSGMLRTAKIPSELFSQRKRIIKVRIGKPITVKDQNRYKELEGFTHFLRKKTYILSSAYDTKQRQKEPRKKMKRLQTPVPIAVGRSEKALYAELAFCRTHDQRLLECGKYEVFLAQKKAIPAIVHEIGRLREITFRAVGEGTNRSIDLDQFDAYYHQLFLWDNEARCIVGAYRIGIGQQIYKTHGIRGFYLQSLFCFGTELHEMMNQSIEIGRAFIRTSHQQRPLPLFLLWRGILHCTLRFPKHKYLIGAVTISDQFSDFSKSLIIAFVTSYFHDPHVAQFVYPRKVYKGVLKDVDKAFVFEQSKGDLHAFDKILEELEPDTLRMPVLLKKYINQNAKAVAFNVDPLFNNAVDTLMYIPIADLPEHTLQPVLEEFEAAQKAKLAIHKPLAMT